MSVTAPDLLAFADQLHSQESSSETLFRAVVGKAYYAAYHDSLQWHGALSAPGSLEPKGSNGTHDQLYQRLKNPTVAAAKIISKQRAYVLRSLHGKRVIADYHLDQTVSQADSSQALADAKSIFALV